MIDGQGRTIDYLRVSVTDKCNLRCAYCMPENIVPRLRHADLLTYEEIVRVVRILAAGAGIGKVRLTGGEPLVRRGLPSLVERLAAVPGIGELALTTNGLLLPQFAGPLRAAGLSRVNVSLDSLRPDRLRQCWRTAAGPADVAAGIDAALAAGLCPVKVNSVVVRGVNDGEIPDLIRWAAARGVTIRFIELMPTAGRNGAVPVAEILDRAGLLGAVVPLGREPGATAAMYAAGGLPFGVIATSSGELCPSCRRLRLTSAGQFKACLARPDAVDVRGLLRGGASDGEILRAALAGAQAKPIRHQGCQHIDMWRVGG